MGIAYVGVTLSAQTKEIPELKRKPAPEDDIETESPCHK